MRDHMTGASLALRRASAADWDAIASLLTGSALPLDGAREHLSGFVVAEREGAVVGCAAIERYEDAGLLRSVAVKAEERGHGTGAALVERCLADASAAGLSALVLLTTTAERYFPRFGFQAIARDAVPASVRRSVEFQSACPASAMVMQRTLRPPSAPEVVVRPARRADAAAIASIYNAGIRGRMATFETRERSVADVEAWFADERHPLLVAESAGRVIGWVRASDYRPRDCYAGIAEFSVYVDPGAQGRRVGDTLMAAFLPALERAGFW
jgi:N-acetylglutamate synthase-like GNAT family acetyltransferase